MVGSVSFMYFLKKPLPHKTEGKTPKAIGRLDLAKVAVFAWCESLNCKVETCWTVVEGGSETVYSGYLHIPYSCPMGVTPYGGTLARSRKLSLASTLKSARQRNKFSGTKKTSMTSTDNDFQHRTPSSHRHNCRILPCHRGPNYPRHRYPSSAGRQTETSPTNRQGFTYTLLEASHKHRLEHRQPKSLRAQRLLNWHKRLSEPLATGLSKRVVFSMLQRQETLQLCGWRTS